MRNVLEFKHESEFSEWENIKGNCIYSIQNSSGKFIGELKEIDLTNLWDRSRIISFDNPKSFIEDNFIKLNYNKDINTCNWGIVNDLDEDVLSKLVHIKLLEPTKCIKSFLP
jgi:hypothetical protein